MKPLIRPATDPDSGPMAELMTQLGYPVDAETMDQRLADVRTRTDDAVLVAVDARDRTLGWIHVARLAVLEAGGLACINGLVVDEHHRSRGIGALLVEAAEGWARSRGATSIMVRSRSTRLRAHGFYERHGYLEVKRSHVFEKPLV